MMSGKRKLWIEQTRLTLESLETRSLLSGFHGVVAPRVVDHQVAIVSSSSSAAKSTAVVARSDSSKSETHLVATLADPTGVSKVTGTAKFESELKRGVAVRELNVEVKGATPRSLINVSITDASGNITDLGRITVKANGTGSLKLTSRSPNVLVDSVISLSSTDSAGAITTLASGKFATPIKGSGGSHDDGGDHSETHLAATLADPGSSLRGSACYESETEHGLVVTELSIELKGGTPGAVIDVSLAADGTSQSTSIGQITIGADGKGRLKLRATAPAVTTSSVISLSTVSTAAGGTVTVTPITSATFASPARTRS
jgi:hypothetical protein